MEERINDLEAKICFQEMALEELNQLVLEQQQTIDKLVQQVRLLSEASADDEGIVDISLETPPPHY